jgi:hypothetical protein
MYAFVDRPVESLCNSGRFMLWAMRGWARAASQRTCPPQAMANAFSRMGALPAMPDFHIAMALINRDALEKLAVAPIEHPHIIEDEAVLIGIWRGLASADPDRTRATLALLVRKESVQPIARAMSAAAAKLVAAGFDLAELSVKTEKEVK